MFNDTAVVPVLARTILMTADAVGGVLTYALSLASELAKTGTKTHLALMGPKLRPEQEAVARAVPGLVLHESTHALEWMDEPWADVARATDWLKGHREGDPPGHHPPQPLLPRSCGLHRAGAPRGALVRPLLVGGGGGDERSGALRDLQASGEARPPCGGLR